MKVSFFMKPHVSIINQPNSFIMKKQLLNLGKALSKAEQRLICGGGDDPISGIGTGGSDGSGVQMGVCFVNGELVQTPCDGVCPNGTAPFCAY